MADRENNVVPLGPADRIRSRAAGAGRRTRRPVIPPPEELRDLGALRPDGRRGAVNSGGVGQPSRTRPAGAARQPTPEPAESAAETREPSGHGHESNGHAPTGHAPTGHDHEPGGHEPGQHEPRPPGEWLRSTENVLDFVRRRLAGEYEVDEFGFDQELTDAVLAAVLRPLYEKYFRVEALGLDNVPADGPALIVANHSGVVAWDALMTQVALLDHHPARRHLRTLGANLVFAMPVIGELARKSGSTLACHADAERLLTAGELVGVWPEGFKGIGKPFAERYKLQRFGRGGFVTSALRVKAPIIPCSIVGAEEIYPMMGSSRTLARLFGLPYFPLTPTFPWLGPLGMVPLPSKWYIQFGEPIDTEPYAASADDPMLQFNLTDQVRETIQQTLYRLLMRRKGVFG